MNFTGVTIEAALTNALVLKKSIVDPAATPTPKTAKLVLFDDSIAPTQFTTAAEIMAAEIEATGYTAGGYTVEDLHGPDKAPGGGVTLTIPSLEIDFTAGFPVTIGGWALIDSDGKVRRYGTFATPRVVASADDGFVFIAQWIEGQNQLVSLVG